MWYKYEMHMHSNEASKCGKSSIVDMVRAYHAAGYSGAVITDHFTLGNTCVPRDLPWKERMQRYYDVYLKGKPVADELDFDLIFGIEYCYGYCKEMLVYNIDIDFLKEHENIDTLPIAEVGRLIHEAGGYISHAHPFRFKPYMSEYRDPTFVMCDSIEVFNYSDSPETNASAEGAAVALGLGRTSGADAHLLNAESVGKAGMAFTHRIRTSQELVDALRAREGKLIVNGELHDTYYA